MLRVIKEKDSHTNTQNCPTSQSEHIHTEQSEHIHTEREVSELIFSRERRERRGVCRRAAQESNLLLRQNHCQP